MHMAARKWVRSLWLRLPEPREFSTLYTIGYTAALLTGLVTLIYPPMSLSAEHGAAAMSSVGALLIAGAIIAMTGGAFSNGKLEMTGIWVQVGALTIYAVIVYGLHLSSPGSRLTQLGVIFLAAIAFGSRWLMVWRFERQIRG